MHFNGVFAAHSHAFDVDLHLRLSFGVHFNPAVMLVDASQGGIPWREVPGYIAAQVAGALLGAWACGSRL